jgi:hypothetical protein
MIVGDGIINVPREAGSDEASPAISLTVIGISACTVAPVYT